MSLTCLDRRFISIIFGPCTLRIATMPARPSWPGTFTPYEMTSYCKTEEINSFCVNSGLNSFYVKLHGMGLLRSEYVLSYMETEL